MGAPVTPVDKDGNPFEAGNPLHVTGTGPGGSSDVVVTNFPASQSVSDSGNAALLTEIRDQNIDIIALLTAIRDNTTTG
jgi:hypothetical protein